jgi:hypothetical protein
MAASPSYLRSLGFARLMHLHRHLNELVEMTNIIHDKGGKILQLEGFVIDIFLISLRVVMKMVKLSKQKRGLSVEFYI